MCILRPISGCGISEIAVEVADRKNVCDIFLSIDDYPPQQYQISDRYLSAIFQRFKQIMVLKKLKR